MTLVRQAVRNAAIGVAIADDPAGLKTFLQPGCAAAVWRRQTPPDVQAWLDSLDPDLLPSGRVILPTDAVSETVGHLLEIYNTPTGPEREWLHEDIVALAHLFSHLTSAKFLRLRLDVVTTNACRKFHIDARTATRFRRRGLREAGWVDASG